MANQDHQYIVILAGGGGTRLWPKSRTETPKQFLKLTGRETMMQIAAMRSSKIVPWEKIIVVTNKKYLEEVKQQLPEVPADQIIAEPEKKDTALAMLVGALYARSLDPEAIVANQASDHIIKDEAEFQRVIKAALRVAAQKKHLVTVGIIPKFPSSGFGYIRIGSELENAERNLPVFNVVSFTEKPKVATAQAFISTGKYFWNANMYVWASETLLKAFEQHSPDFMPAIQPLLSLKGKAFHDALPEVYKQAPSISIDYAISEKADNLVLIPGDFGWDDVGDWKVVYDLGKKDFAGNVIISDEDQVNALAVESQNNLVHADGRMIALLGVNDYIIVDTKEILMIVPKHRSQDVKKIVERLKEEKQEKYL